MGIVTWVLVGIVLGVATGFIAGRSNIIATVILGLVGSVLAGWISTLFGLGTFSAFNIWNLLISIGGAVIVLIAYYVVRRNREG